MAVLTYFALQEASGMLRGRALRVFVGAALVAEVVSKIAVVGIASLKQARADLLTRCAGHSCGPSRGNGGRN
jgi:hypothetical protein